LLSVKLFSEKDVEKHLPRFLAFFAMLIGAILMLSLVLREDFPRNDGGMFYVMVKDLIANNYRLPENTSYNNAHIPYVYPPLSFYLAALLSDIFSFSLIEIERWLPFFFSLSSILALGLLARAILKSNIQAALSMLAFALLPPTFDRLIMGGGLARAPGLFFCLVSLYWINRLFQTKSGKFIIPAIVFSAFVVLTHPVYAWFSFFSAALLLAFSKPGRRDILHSILVLIGVILLSAPWWIDILVLHGSSNIIGAYSSRPTLSLALSVVQLFSFEFTSERLLDILGVMAVIGLVRKTIDRDFFFLSWLVIIFLLERTSPLPLVAIPLSMLVGVGVDNLIFHNALKTSTYVRRVLFITFCFFVSYSILASYMQLTSNYLNKETRDAMRWISANIPAQSRFIVITNNNWWDDPNSEWFPALAERISVNTVQGSEWTPNQGFSKRIAAYNLLRQCSLSDNVNCLDEWQQTSGEEFSHILIPKQNRNSQEAEFQSDIYRLREGLVKSSDYTVVYDRYGVTILKKIN
jgi:hypothetical protein